MNNKCLLQGSLEPMCFLSTSIRQFFICFTAILSSLQPVAVSRQDPDSRKNTVAEITRRALSRGQWPQVINTLLTSLLSCIPIPCSLCITMSQVPSWTGFLKCTEVKSALRYMTGLRKEESGAQKEFCCDKWIS